MYYMLRCLLKKKEFLERKLPFLDDLGLCWYYCNMISWFSNVFRDTEGCVQLFTPQLNALNCSAFCVPVFALYSFCFIWWGCHLKFFVLSLNRDLSLLSFPPTSPLFFFLMLIYRCEDLWGSRYRGLIKSMQWIKRILVKVLGLFHK